MEGNFVESCRSSSDNIIKNIINHLNRKLKRYATSTDPVSIKIFLEHITHMTDIYGFSLPKKMIQIFQKMPENTMICIDGFQGQCFNCDTCIECLNVKKYAPENWKYWKNNANRKEITQNVSRSSMNPRIYEETFVYPLPVPGQAAPYYPEIIPEMPEINRYDRRTHHIYGAPPPAYRERAPIYEEPAMVYRAQREHPMVHTKPAPYHHREEKTMAYKEPLPAPRDAKTTNRPQAKPNHEKHCKYAELCNNKDCRYIHPCNIECKFGENCYRIDCAYYHPYGQLRSQSMPNSITDRDAYSNSPKRFEQRIPKGEKNVERTPSKPIEPKAANTKPFIPAPKNVQPKRKITIKPQAIPEVRNSIEKKEEQIPPPAIEVANK